MVPEQYVGITGFETGAQVAAIRIALPADRLLMVGVGMRGHPIEWAPDKWPNRNPRPEKLPGIFGPHHNVLNMLHFTPLPGCDLYEHLCMAYETAGPHFDGFQLNTPWPDIAALVRYRSRFPDAVITIPLQPDALDIVGWEPDVIAQRLKRYQDIARYTLIDASAGYGQELDVQFTRKCLSAIRALMPNMGLIAAGGLCAENAEEKLGELLAEFPLSTDAEGKLRTPDDHLSVTESIRYVQTSDALFRRFKRERVQSP
mgnify:CR=1 FL=1